MNLHKYARSEKRVQVPVDGVSDYLSHQMISQFGKFKGHGVAPFIRERIVNPYIEMHQMDIDINYLLEACKQDEKVKILLQAYTDRYRAKEAAA